MSTKVQQENANVEQGSRPIDDLTSNPESPVPPPICSQLCYVSDNPKMHA